MFRGCPSTPCMQSKAQLRFLAHSVRHSLITGQRPHSAEHIKDHPSAYSMSQSSKYSSSRNGQNRVLGSAILRKMQSKVLVGPADVSTLRLRGCNALLLLAYAVHHFSEARPSRCQKGRHLIVTHRGDVCRDASVTHIETVLHC